jgi:hypothetical protein
MVIVLSSTALLRAARPRVPDAGASTVTAMTGSMPMSVANLGGARVPDLFQMVGEDRGTVQVRW